MPDAQLTLTWPLIESWHPCPEALTWGHQTFNGQPQPTRTVLRRLIRTKEDATQDSPLWDTAVEPFTGTSRATKWLRRLERSHCVAITVQR